MDPILEIVERSNQRGQRMLSVVDLIEAGTLDLPLAAWLAERIRSGASWLVGARPGAAGKTTIMSALLALLPPLASGRAIRLAASGTGWERSAPGDCVVAFEIGGAGFESYIWGDDVVHFAALARRGVRVVTNLHADTVAEARGQIVERCGAREEDFNAIGLFVPIRTHEGPGRHDMSRKVTEAMLHDGHAWRPFSAKDAAAALAGEAVASVVGEAVASVVGEAAASVAGEAAVARKAATTGEVGAPKAAPTVRSTGLTAPAHDTSAKSYAAAGAEACVRTGPGPAADADAVDRLRATAAFLDDCRVRGLRLVEEVRHAWLEHLAVL